MAEGSGKSLISGEGLGGAWVHYRERPETQRGSGLGFEGLGVSGIRDLGDKGFEFRFRGLGVLGLA